MYSGECQRYSIVYWQAV